MKYKIPKDSPDDLTIASSIRCVVEAMFQQTIYLVKSKNHPELTMDKAVDGLSKVLERIGSIMEKRWRDYLWIKYNQILKQYQNYNPDKEEWLRIKADMIDKDDTTWLN